MSSDSFALARKNRVFAPLIFAISILILVFFTRSLYGEYSQNQTELSSVTSSVDTKQSEYDALVAIEKSVQSATSDNSARIAKIEKPFNNSDVIEAVMVNDYTKGSSFSPARITISDVDVDEGTKLPSGIILGKVNISLTASTVDDIVAYLTYLSENSPIAFVLDTIDLPLDTAESTSSFAATTLPKSVSLSVTLGVYSYP